jgi:hypothetical protein
MPPEPAPSLPYLSSIYTPAVLTASDDLLLSRLAESIRSVKDVRHRLIMSELRQRDHVRHRFCLHS